MNIIEIIEKKRDNYILNEEEITYFVNGYCNGSIKDYQASSLLMAICINGMNREETIFLTKAMLNSGKSLDLSSLSGIKVDKHSTGGVGDKTSLVLGPMCAACGLKFAKMSGRGLGHTGGTLDKLESIKGLSISLDEESFIKQVQNINLAIIGQNEQFTPADKKMYALRDVTGTIPSIPLIASSIMSKKLAAGAEIILLDVKYGDGAFMKTKEEALILAKTMIEIGEGLNRKVQAEITNMNEPLGNAIGNSLEVLEAIKTLKGKGPKDFEELCIHSGAKLLLMSGLYIDEMKAKSKMKSVLYDGSAYDYFIKMVSAQKGIIKENQVVFVDDKVYKKDVYTKECGYINSIKTKELGLLSCKLGAGRFTKEDIINLNAGIHLYKKVNDYINKDEVLLTLYGKEEIDENIIKEALNCFYISKEKIEKENLIYMTL